MNYSNTAVNYVQKLDIHQKKLWLDSNSLVRMSAGNRHFTVLV